MVRRDRHLCEGIGREQCAGRRPIERCVARGWRGVARQGDWRRREPGSDASGTHRVRTRRGADQYRLHRQLRRGRLLRQRGQHQDRPGGCKTVGPVDGEEAGRTAGRDDRRGCRAGAGEQPAPGAGAVDRRDRRRARDRGSAAADRGLGGTRRARPHDRRSGRRRYAGPPRA